MVGDPEPLAGFLPFLGAHDGDQFRAGRDVDGGRDGVVEALNPIRVWCIDLLHGTVAGVVDGGIGDCGTAFVDDGAGGGGVSGAGEEGCVGGEGGHVCC